MVAQQRDLDLSELRQMMQKASEPYNSVDWGRAWFTLIPRLAGGLRPEEVSNLSLEKWKELFGANAFEIAIALQATVIERALTMGSSSSMDPTFNATKALERAIRRILHAHRLVRYLDPN